LDSAAVRIPPAFDRPDRAALDAAAAALAPCLAALLPALWDALLASVRLRDRWLLPAVATGEPAARAGA